MTQIASMPTGTDWVRRGALCAWANLHLVVVASVPIGAAVWLCVNLSGHWFAAGLLLVILLPVPLAAGLILTSTVLLQRAVPRGLWRRRLVEIGRLAAVCALVLLAVLLAVVASQSHAMTQTPLSLISMILGAGGAASALVVATGMVPYLSAFPRTRIRNLILITLAGLAKAPMPVIAAVAGLGLGVWIAMSVPILWAVVPGLCLLTVQAAGWTTAAALDLHPERIGNR